MDVYKIHRSGGEVHGTENMPKSKLQPGADEDKGTDVQTQQKESLSKVCGSNLEEMYNKLLQESGIDTKGMEWTEKKELGDVLLLSKGEPLPDMKGIDHSEELAENAEAKDSSDSGNHAEQTVDGGAAGKAVYSLRKRTLGQTARGEVTAVCVEGDEGDDGGEEPSRKEPRLVQTTTTQREQRRQPVRLARKNKTETQRATNKDGAVKGGRSQKETADIVVEKSADGIAVLQELHCDTHSSAANTIANEPTLSSTASQGTLRQPQKVDSAYSYLDLDEDETQPPDSPDLFKEESVQVPTENVSPRPMRESNDDLFQVVSSEDESLGSRNAETADEAAPCGQETRCKVSGQSRTDGCLERMEDGAGSQPPASTPFSEPSTEQNRASLETDITSPDHSPENQDESQSPTFKKKVLSMDKMQIPPSRKLHRNYRKYKEKMRLRAPLFSRPSEDPVTYAAVILQLFDCYMSKLRRAQSAVVGHTTWGDPVSVGRHMSRTLDVKRRGQLSINWSDDSQSESPNETGSEHNKSLKLADAESDDSMESLPDIPSSKPVQVDNRRGGDQPECIAVEAVVEDGDTAWQTLNAKDVHLYSDDTEEISKRGDDEFRLFTNTASVNSPVTSTAVGSKDDLEMKPSGREDDLEMKASGSEDDLEMKASGSEDDMEMKASGREDDLEMKASGSEDDLEMKTSQCSNSLLASQIDQKLDTNLATVDDAHVISDSENSESLSSPSLNEWSTLRENDFKDINTYERKPHTTLADRNRQVEIEWVFDKQSQQMKRTLLKTNDNQLTPGNGAQNRHVHADVDICGDRASSDDYISKKASVKSHEKEDFQNNSQCESSPRVGDSSQRIADSPQRVVDSSQRVSDSPRIVADSSQRVVDSSLRIVDSPRRRVDSPRRRVDSPQRRVDSPLRRVDSPRRRVDSPVGLDDSPQGLVESSNCASSPSQTECSRAAGSPKKATRKSFKLTDSDDNIRELETEPSPSSSAPSDTSGTTPIRPSTSSGSRLVIDVDNTSSTRQETTSHVACPLCSEFFNSSQIEIHASGCEGPVVHQTRKRKHHDSAESNDQDVEIGYNHLVEEQKQTGHVLQPMNRKTRLQTAVTESSRTDDDLHLSEGKQKAKQIRTRQTEECMICNQHFLVGMEYEQHVDGCIQAAIEKNKSRVSEDRGPTQVRTKGGLIGELQAVWDKPESTDADNVISNGKKNSATSSEAKRFKACETSSDDGDVGKEPNWLEADLSSPIKSFKRISELEETCMDFKNQFKVRDKVSSKGQWKSFRKGRKGKRRK